MTKLCPRGKAAAKRKFKVYPSAYANAYASKICAGKIKDPSGVKRKDFKGPKPAGKAMGGRIGEKDKIRPLRKKGKTPRSTKPFLTIDQRRQRQRKGPAPNPRENLKSGGLAKKGRGCEIR